MGDEKKELEIKEKASQLRTKILIFSFMLLIGSLLAGGCSIMKNKTEDKKLLKNAEEETVKFFKEKEHVDVIVTKSEFSSAIGGDTIFVDGYVKEDPTRKISADVHYKDNYNIDSFGLDKKKE
ncbi:hypothetical protein [Ectobacillus panaciterrae]|uniref:hypothetical protein n=1 Tax=Ectobacillus panaciterrae TaxID=363872 RepID=UPI00040D2207|nr:hypothetical protein [Ectobacillus panaciterrae]